jgi:hypothetical protein
MNLLLRIFLDLGFSRGLAIFRECCKATIRNDDIIAVFEEVHPVFGTNSFRKYLYLRNINQGAAHIQVIKLVIKMR